MDYRGKGKSQTKVCKNGAPKRSGNFSYSAIHFQSLQSRDYHVKRVDGCLIVGEHTPLSAVMPAAVVVLIEADKLFNEYIQRGTTTVNNKKYESCRRLIRFSAYGKHSYLDYEFVLREEIYTDGDFDWKFKEY